jgi:hypothetical protein
MYNQDMNNRCLLRDFLTSSSIDSKHFRRQLQPQPSETSALIRFVVAVYDLPSRQKRFLMFLFSHVRFLHGKLQNKETKQHARTIF